MCVSHRYVQQDILQPGDANFRHFYKIFEMFKLSEPEKPPDQPQQSPLEVAAKSVAASKKLAAAAEKEDSDDEEEEKVGEGSITMGRIGYLSICMARGVPHRFYLGKGISLHLYGEGGIIAFLWGGGGGGDMYMYNMYVINGRRNDGYQID